MKKLSLNRVMAAAMVAVAAVSLVGTPMDAEAKRLGSGRPAGMQRQMPAKPAPNTPPSQQATPQQAPAQQAAPTQAANPAQAAPGMAQAAPKRSWMGPIAGLAAGLGLAALASHFGFGEALANGMMMALLAVVAVVAIGWLVRRMRSGANAGSPLGGPQYAGAGASAGGGAFNMPASQPAPAAANNMAREAHNVFGGTPASLQTGGAPAAVAPQAAQFPPGFDADGFTRVAKMIFIRLQAANDEGNVDDLRKFTTPELFASLRLDLQERQGSTQRTDVVQLNAELADAAQADGQWVVSVKFSGLIKEAPERDAEAFQELWHLVKPVQGEADWAIAGITPLDHAA